MHGPSPETLASLWLVFLGGLASSAHCLGMCGPLVAFAEGLRPGKWQVWSQLPMHLGRMITYAFLGLIAGGLGFAIKKGGQAAGFLQLASIIGGVLMILFAMGMVGWLPAKIMNSVGNKFSEKFGKAMASDNFWGGLKIGLYWGFLPCGMVWAWMGGAVGSGSPINGALVMFFFGLGTVPALLVIGGLGGMLGHKFRDVLNKIGSITVALLGLILILRGLSRAGIIPVIKLAPGVPIF